MQKKGFCGGKKYLRGQNSMANALLDELSVSNETTTPTTITTTTTQHQDKLIIVSTQRSYLDSRGFISSKTRAQQLTT
jgi:hypothetical protein